MQSKADIELNKIESSTEITFIDAKWFSDNTLVRITAKTYDAGLLEVIDSIDIIFKDTKKRQKRTLEKLEIEKEALLNGVEHKDGLKSISEYFINHNELVVGIDTKNKIRKINKSITEFQLKQLDVVILNLEKEADYCGISAPKESFNDMYSNLKKCIRKYEVIKNMEYNKYDCVVNYAYYQSLEFSNNKSWICCVTSIGKIIYDINRDEWSMTKKEQKVTGLRIENFDVDNIKSQLKEKYNVISIIDLYEKLKQKSLQRQTA